MCSLVRFPQVISCDERRFEEEQDEQKKLAANRRRKKTKKRAPKLANPPKRSTADSQLDATSKQEEGNHP